MRDKIIEFFTLLTSIDSPSGKEAALAETLEGILVAKGFAVQRDDIGNIIARRGEGEPLLLCCHMDTVESSAGLRQKIDGDFICSSGDTILGADDKAGIAILLSCLESLDCDPALEVVLSVQEETGMQGTKSIKPGVLNSKWGLVLDAGEAVGAVINQAPGETDLDIVFHGKGAHAAANPEMGIDAIRLAARFLDDLPPVRIASDSTFNMGVIRGGQSTNMICPRVQILGEIRSFSTQRRKDIARTLENLAESAVRDSGGRYDFTSNDSYTGYLVDKDHGLIQLLDKTAVPLKIVVDVHPRFAGSDANILNSLGVDSVNLGVGVEKGHSFQERVSITALESMTEWLKAILKEWCHGRSQS